MIYQKDACYDLYLHVQYALQIVFHAMLTHLRTGGIFHDIFLCNTSRPNTKLIV